MPTVERLVAPKELQMGPRTEETMVGHWVEWKEPPKAEHWVCCLVALLAMSMVAAKAVLKDAHWAESMDRNSVGL